MELARTRKVDPSRKNNILLVRAARHGLTSHVKFMLADPRVDPTINHCESLYKAVVFGKANVVRAILADGRCDPNAGGGYIRRALTTEAISDMLAGRVQP